MFKLLGKISKHDHIFPNSSIFYLSIHSSPQSLVKIALKSQLHDPQVWTDCLVLISNQLNVRKLLSSLFLTTTLCIFATIDVSHVMHQLRSS